MSKVSLHIVTITTHSRTCVLLDRLLKIVKDNGTHAAKSINLSQIIENGINIPVELIVEMDITVL